MDLEIEQISKQCEMCCINQNNPEAAPVHMWEQPNEPWERIHLDYAGVRVFIMGHLGIGQFSLFISFKSNSVIYLL